MRRATLKDIAAMAGVSTATVARVLHNNGYVAPRTRELVERAIAETGYQINAVAQGLRRQRTYTVGHVLHSIIPNQFFAAVAEGVEDVASRHECAVLMMTTHGDAARERKAVETLIQRRVDAIIFTTATHVDNVRLAVSAGIPVVQVERMTSVETPAVTADNYGGAYAATEHVISLGHRRIGLIGVDSAAVRSRPGSATHPDVEQERLSGFLGAMRDRRIPVDETLIHLEDGYITDAAAPKNRGYLPMCRLLDAPEPPTAVVTTFDLLAAGALQAIYERGLRVPDDISVVGFDDTYAPYLTPPLTAVRNPMLDMGRHAARLVFQHLGGPVDGTVETGKRLPMELVVRLSTAVPASVVEGVADVP
jgi:DNA-binding LacI/PurR family transcriptional regulator